MKSLKRTLSSLVIAVLMLLAGTIVQLPFASAAVEDAPDLSTIEAVNKFLLSRGVDPATAVFQEGLLNYAGPNCPGAEWNCVDSSVPIVQTALPGGTNEFECAVDLNSCFVVQREVQAPEQGGGLFTGTAHASGSGTSTNTNNASCFRAGGGTDTTQTCTLTQVAGSPANPRSNNRATVAMVIVQRSGDEGDDDDGSFCDPDDDGDDDDDDGEDDDDDDGEDISGGDVTQSAEQSAFISQTSGSGSNSATITQAIFQTGASAETTTNPTVEQLQNAKQRAEIDQQSTSGANLSNTTQLQFQKLFAESGAGSITQSQNPDPDTDAQPNPNATAVVNQDSSLTGGGRQDSKVNQLIDQEASARSDVGPISQTQGSTEGGIQGTMHQASSGVSTYAVEQRENQDLNADTEPPGTLTQQQHGPVDCCEIPPFLGGSQTGNPNNRLTIKQSSNQNAEDCDAVVDNNEQDTVLRVIYETDGQGTATQEACQDGECTTNSVSGTGTQTATIACVNGTCATSSGPPDDGGVVAGPTTIPLIEDCGPEGTPNECTGTPPGGTDHDMAGPTKGIVSYSQDASGNLTITIVLVNAAPSTGYSVFAVCGLTGATACGFVTADEELTTDALGNGTATVDFTAAELLAGPFDCGPNNGHLDLLDGVGDDSAGLYTATPLTFTINCAPPIG